MKQQIEEMAKDLKENLRLCAGVKLFDHDVETIAYELCKQGYQKVGKDSVVMIITELIEKYRQEHEWASQETAKDIWKRFNLFFRPFDKKDAISIDLLLLFLENIVKQYGVKVEL